MGRDDFAPNNGAPVKRRLCLALNPESWNVVMVCTEQDRHAGDHAHTAFGKPKSERITWPNEEQAA